MDPLPPEVPPPHIIDEEKKRLEPKPEERPQLPLPETRWTSFLAL